MPMTVDGHLPERHAIGEYVPPPPPTLRPPPPRGRGLPAPRVFRPPVPVEVVMRDTSISSMRGDGIEGSVILSSGPWRIEEGWWRGTPEFREYWDVELDRGGIYRVYENGDWFVDARYDA